jgi:hypothetical protein
MDYAEKWVIRDELGEGGQGKVYLVSQKLKELNAMNKVANAIRQFSSITTQEMQTVKFNEFRDGVTTMLELEDPSQQGALKVLHSPDDATNPDSCSIPH